MFTLFFDRHAEGQIVFFARGLSSALSPPSFTDRSGDFLSCFIDSSDVCQRLARGNQTQSTSRLVVSLSAVQSLFSLMDQVLELQRLSSRTAFLKSTARSGSHGGLHCVACGKRQNSSSKKTSITKLSKLRFLAELHTFIEHVSSIIINSVKQASGNVFHLVTLVGSLRPSDSKRK